MPCDHPAEFVFVEGQVRYMERLKGEIRISGLSLLFGKVSCSESPVTVACHQRL